MKKEDENIGCASVRDREALCRPKGGQSYSPRVCGGMVDRKGNGEKV